MENKRLFSLMGVMFLIGMLFGFMSTKGLSNFTNKEEKAKMVVEEISTTNLSDSACSQISDLDGIDVSDIDTVSSREILRTLVKSISDDKSVLTIKHANYNVEYIVNKNLSDELKVYVNKDYSKYLNKLDINYILFITARLNVLLPNIPTIVNGNYDNIFIPNTPNSINARARSPGNYWGCYDIVKPSGAA